MIRQFVSSDAPACFDIICSSIRSDTSISLSLQNRLLENESPVRMLERASLFYIAVSESEGEIAGLGGIDLNEIRLLFVSPLHRRKGIGRAITEHLESLVPPELFKDIFVYAAPGAVGFYRALGFEARGESVFEIKDLLLQTVFMTKLTR